MGEGPKSVMMAGARGAVIGLLLCGQPPAQAATVEGTVTLGSRPVPQAVIYLERTGAPPAVASPARVVMDQRNLNFVPAVLPVVRGTAIEFTNSDDVQHNVFSPSATAGKFNLGTYGPGATRTITLNEPGDVLVLCNIHMEMQAHILVLNDPYFSLVTADSTYRIADVPPGTYVLKIWHEHWLTFSQSVEVPAAESLTVNVTAGK